MLTTKQNIINRKIKILQSDMTQVGLANKIGITYMGLHKAMTGLTKNPRMHERICAALGVSKEEFWPEFYGPESKHDTTVTEQVNAVN